MLIIQIRKKVLIYKISSYFRKFFNKDIAKRAKLTLFYELFVLSPIQ
jgi:hypothetical protein